MDQSRRQSLTNSYHKPEHFSGIGIDNVDNRLKLLYGSDYGVNIVSREGGGATVSIVFPARHAQKQTEREPADG